MMSSDERRQAAEALARADRDRVAIPVDIAPGEVIQVDYGPLGALGVSFT